MPEYEWLWTRDNWTEFQFDSNALQRYNAVFAFNRENGSCPSIHFDPDDHSYNFAILSSEVVASSEIEGVKMHPESVVQSMRIQFDEIALHRPRTDDSDQRRSGIISAMIDSYLTYDEPLSQDMLNHWNALITRDEEGLSTKGTYRTHEDPMVITASARITDDSASYIAPPSEKVPELMDDFIEWYNDTSPSGSNPLPPLIRSSLAHLYFVMIHPYEDGNGRMSRLIAEKALSESYGKPTLVSLSHRIAETKGEYYEHLENAARYGNIDGWMDYFCRTITEAQKLSAKKLQKATLKMKIMDKHGDQLNPRQEKLLEKMLHPSKGQFEKGISYTKYARMNANLFDKEISNNQQALDDLDKMVDMGILIKPGDRKNSNYCLRGLGQARPTPTAQELRHTG